MVTIMQFAGGWVAYLDGQSPDETFGQSVVGVAHRRILNHLADNGVTLANKYRDLQVTTHRTV
jgi:hypothetical protein